MMSELENGSHNYSLLTIWLFRSALSWRDSDMGRSFLCLHHAA